jgi:hypothetical protein
MSITASGLYGLTLVKFLNVTSLPASGLVSTTAVKVMMVTDSETPDFNADNFRDDVTANEVTDSLASYVAGGKALGATPTLAVSGGVLTYDAPDVSWASSTIANAMAAVGYFARGGADTADELIFLSDFVNQASSSNGTFQISWSGTGIFTVDYTP